MKLRTAHQVTAVGEGQPRSNSLESPGVIHLESNPTGNPADELGTMEFDARVEANQRRLAAELQPSYDFIVLRIGLVRFGRCSPPCGEWPRLRATTRGRGHRRRAERKRSATMAHQFRNGTALELSGRTQSIAQWAPAPA